MNYDVLSFVVDYVFPIILFTLFINERRLRLKREEKIHFLEWENGWIKRQHTDEIARAVHWMRKYENLVIKTLGQEKADKLKEELKGDKDAQSQGS